MKHKSVLLLRRPHPIPYVVMSLADLVEERLGFRARNLM